MMGTQQSQKDLFNYQVNLDQRVRPDHPLRRIAAVLDLSFVRPLVAAFYGQNGHVSVDPEVLVKMLLLLFLDDLPSERELMAVIAERLDYMWFLGYGLDDPIPNHSVLSKARARWGKEVFRTLFERTVAQCLAAGLVEGRKLYVDSSLIKAHASKDSVVQTSPELAAALRQAYETQEQKLQELTPGSVNATHVSTTDPEATLARGRGTPVNLSYKHHRAIDDAQGVITAVKTTTGIASDPAQLQELVGQHQENTGQAVNIVVGDRHYGTAENYRYCQVQGITSHLGEAQTNIKGGVFSPAQFEYEAEGDRYRCPAGEYLYYHNFKKEQQLVEYRIKDPAICASCKFRSECTHSKTGRSVTRPIFSELVQLGCEQARSESARRDLARRKHLLEGSFADASNNHGFKRARWCGLWRQQIQDWLIAAVQNLRILLKRRPNFASSPAQRTVDLGRAVLQLLAMLVSVIINSHNISRRCTKEINPFHSTA